MELIKTEEITENETTYIVNTYDNGTVEKYIKSDPDAVTPEPEPQPKPLTNEDIDQKLTDTQNILIDAMSGMADLYETAMSNQQMQLDTMSGLADLFDMMVASEGGTTN